MYLVMNDLDPVSQLETLLGPRPMHPWAALIPQIILWSFRRFCISKLCKTSDASLTEQIWDNHTELIDLYAPKGLEVAASIWVTPENIDLVHSSLEDYNYFFLNVLAMIDGALVNADTDAEDMMATFLDTDMSNIIYNWVENKEFLIFPMANEDDDVFSDEQYMKLLVNLTEYSKTYSEMAQPESEAEEAQAQVEAEAEAEEAEAEAEAEEAEAEQFLEDPPEVRIEVYGEIYKEPEPEPEPELEVESETLPEVKTVKEAFNYRRTFKNRPTPRRITKKRIFA
jgi:hypothetical protein